MTNDSDWLVRDGDPPSIPPAADAAGNTVMRRESFGEPWIGYPSIEVARVQRPATCEAVLCDANDVLLAEAIFSDVPGVFSDVPGVYEWSLTMAGDALVRREAVAA